MSEPTTADRVRAGLVRLVRDPAWWPTAHPAAFRNRLLDEGGGDSRPHVELAWRLHELRVAERLARADGPPLARCRTVARDLAAEALLDRDATRWGVETWALALGVLDELALAAERRADRDAVRSAARSVGEAPASGVGPAHATLGGPRGAALAGRGPVPAAASGAVPGGASPAAPPKRRWTIGTPGTPKGPLPRGPAPRAVAGVVALILGLFAVVIGGARLVRPTSGMASRQGATTETAAAGASSGEPVVAPGSTVASPPDAPPPDVPPGVRGEVRLRDGRRLGGVIDLVTASDVFLHDTTTGLPMAMPLAFVSEVRTAEGRVAWRSPTAAVAGAESSPAVAPAVALRARGVAGTYRVTVQSASVDGDPSCREAWQGAPRTLTETVSHVPGAPTARLASRPGVELSVDPDGRFVAAPATGVDGATRWRFAMRGAFAPEGFVATSDLRTETTLRWRKVQRCWIRADLAGVRRR